MDDLTLPPFPDTLISAGGKLLRLHDASRGAQADRPRQPAS
jgi:hypothetical protein